MTADEIAQRLEGVRRNGTGFMAKCPAHEDSHQSLSIRDSSSGILFKCHTGCEAVSVISAMGLEWKDVMPEDDAPYRPASVSQKVDSYVYQDESGVPSYRNDRYYPKDFKVSHFDLATDTWVYGLNGNKRLPFHLPQLLEAKGNRTVFFVEGERKVLTLEKMGFAATTTGGATSWKPEIGEFFRGARKVVILPDNDEPGRKHATTVSGDLSKLGVDVQVVELPDLPPKGDIVDWVARGGTREALEAIVKGVAPGGIRIYSGESLRAVPAKDPVFVIDGVIQRGLNVLAGSPKSGKSLIVTEMGHAVARGTLALNKFQTDQGAALLFSLEDSIEMMKRRMSAMYGDFPENFVVTRDKPGDIFRNGWKNVESCIKAIGNVKLVVVDTLACVYAGATGRGSVYGQDSDFGHAVHDWAMKMGVGLILIHHDRKMKADSTGDPLDDISGSKGLVGAAVGIIMFRRQRFEDNGRLQIVGKELADKEWPVHRTAVSRWVVTPEPPQADVIPFEKGRTR